MTENRLAEIRAQALDDCREGIHRNPYACIPNTPVEEILAWEQGRQQASNEVWAKFLKQVGKEGAA